MRYFYFSKDDKKLCYDDNRVIKAGITHKVGGEHGLCEHGLHASKNIIDTLRYAPGNHLWIVELSGEVAHCRDKSCATERKYICGANIEKILRKFARECAMVNIESIKRYCSDENYNLVVEWLETGDDEILRCIVWDSVDNIHCVAIMDARGAAARDAAYGVYCAAAKAAAKAAYCVADNTADNNIDRRLISMLPQRLRDAIIGG